MKGSVVERVQRTVDESLPRDDRSLLAVSGGVDSMVMLHAAHAVRDARRLIVATFDHASGPHAAAAVDLVERVALRSGLSVVTGRGEPRDRSSEAEWRTDRIAFLRAAAREHQALVCTAHTRDDQVETVLFREMRGSGPRGLAGLAAKGESHRPLLAVSRREVSDYARAAGVEWLDDPSNLDLSYSRNRLRHEILPALRSVRPGIDDELATIGERAARWRADLDAYIDAGIAFDVDRELETLEVSGERLRHYSDDALGIIWPALLARLGVAADWRGTRRLAAFTIRGRTGQCIQLSGGWTVYKRRRGFEIRRAGTSDR